MSGWRNGLLVLAKADMIARDGGRRMGDADIVVVAKERSTVVHGRTDNGDALTMPNRRDSDAGDTIFGDGSRTICSAGDGLLVEE